MKRLKIGKLRLDSPFILAPMSGICCNAFRLLCRDFGAGLVYSGKIEEEKFRRARIYFDDFIKEERPVGAQIMGDNIQNLKIIVDAIQEKVDVIDFNAGCSKQSYIDLGWGAWYTNHHKELKKVLSKLREIINVPFTLKTRLGFEKGRPTILDAVKICEDVGIDAISIHGRFAVHSYIDRADLDLISKAKEKANIPVIANGDVFSPQDAVNVLTATKCDGVMIGRGALGNPFIFRDASMLLEGKKPEVPALSDKLNAFSKFMEYYRKYDPTPGFSEIRMHAIWFVKNTDGCRKLKYRIQSSKNLDELEMILKEHD